MIKDTDRHPPGRWLALAVLCASLLLVGMDLTVLHVAVPTISRQLLPSGSELLWIVDGYALTVAAGLITCGTLADRFGRKRMLMAGFAVFGLASLGAALAAGPGQLIAARVVLGVGGAIIMSSTPAIIPGLFPDDRERSLAVGLWVSAYSVGVSVGPLLGGMLIEHFWWGSVFLVNLPIVVVALVAGVLLIPESKNPHPHRWDGTGAALSAAGLAAVVYGFQKLGEGAGSTGLPVSVLVAGLLLLAAFVVRQRRISTPLLDLSHFADRRFTVAALCTMVCYGSYAALLFLLTQRLQLADGHSPLQAGLAMTPLAVANAAGAALAPKLTVRIGNQRGLSGGLLLLAAALVAFAVFGVENNYPALIAAGFGSGAVMTLGSDTMLSAARPERAGEVGAIQETSFSLGAGLGLAFLGTIMTLVYRSTFGSVPEATGEQVETARTSLGAASEVAARLGDRAGDALLERARESFDTGFEVATSLSAGALALLGVLILLDRRKSPPSGPPEERGSDDPAPLAENATADGRTAD
ncbi:MFS transporter [Streptomyces sp. YU58]|uniref:MFS transporter n=1 Tax=Streptomyces sp. SX92 TaxID=3158972 RepID=UPI0027B9EB45|nr:MFS transporter [Streptomyces coralus]WLW54746.1 MFS transporter [Streptomyces coralus]